jgi:propane monooxygenase reductase component
MADKKHLVTFSDPVNIEIEVDEDETILEAGFRNGLMLYHACKEGQCAACKNFLIDGDVDHDKYSTFALSDREKDEGYVLLCKAFAYSDCEIEVLHWDEGMRQSGVPIQDVQTEVAEIESLTHDIRRLTLKCIDPPEMAFNSGQYVDIKIPVPGTDKTAYKRSYSMANTPETSDRLEFIIKMYPDGRFSSLLDGTLAPGQRLDIRGPYGTFTFREKADRDMIFVGGGAGMSPLWSLVNSMATQGIERKVTFYYGARSKRDLFFAEEMLELAKRMPSFTFVPALSEAEDRDHWKGETGFITDVFDALEDDLSDHDAYLCGPPPMIDAAIPLLIAKGIPENRIYFDKFTTTASSEEEGD